MTQSMKATIFDSRSIQLFITFINLNYKYFIKEQKIKSTDTSEIKKINTLYGDNVED